MITIYGSVTCAKCKIVKEYFKKQKIEFKYIDIDNTDTDISNILTKIHLYKTGLPFIDLDGDYATFENFKDKINDT